MQIKKLEKQDYNRYSEFLLEFKDSLLYYTIKYKMFLEELLDIQSNYLLVIDKNTNIQAILPLMIKDGKFGKIINSLPYYGSNGGILSKNNEAYDLLFAYYNKLTTEVSGSTYISNPLQENTQVFDYDIQDKRIGQWTNLSYSNNIEENIMNSYDSSARRNVRKAIKENVTIDIDNTQIDFLYETHHKNITEIGGKAKNKSFFDLINKHFEKEKDYNIYIAKRNGEKIGALLLFYYNETVEYFTPAAISEYRNVQALPFIIYQAMVDANKRNFKWWNWGGTWLTQDGVYKFKNKFGAIDKEYHYYIKINNNDIYNSNKIELLEEYDNFYIIPFDKIKG